MGHKYTEKEKNLYNAIDEILWRDWDPIGVNGISEVRDEYYSYLPEVYSLTLKNSSTLEIANYLFMIEKDYMGCPSTWKIAFPLSRK